MFLPKIFRQRPFMVFPKAERFDGEREKGLFHPKGTDDSDPIPTGFEPGIIGYLNNNPSEPLRLGSPHVLGAFSCTKNCLTNQAVRSRPKETGAKRSKVWLGLKIPCMALMQGKCQQNNPYMEREPIFLLMSCKAKRNVANSSSVKRHTLPCTVWPFNRCENQDLDFWKYFSAIYLNEIISDMPFTAVSVSICSFTACISSPMLSSMTEAATAI